MGRPVITLAGHEHRSRVGVSLLTAAGHSEWVAETDTDFVRLAAALAANRPHLAAASAALRTDLRASPLLAHATQSRRFGETLRACVAAILR